MAVAAVGEDAFVWCETATTPRTPKPRADAASCHEVPAPDAPAAEKVHTPDLPGIEAWRSTWSRSRTELLKCIAFDVDGELGLALVPGDREVNEFALDQALAPRAVRLLHRRRLRGARPICRRATSARTSPARSIVVADPLGARAAPVDHRRERDRPPRAGTRCSAATSRRRSGPSSRASSSPATRARGAAQPLRIDRGIEVGHVFQLGTKYTEALGATLHRRGGRAAPDGDGLLRHRGVPDRRRGRRGAPRRERDRLAGRARAVSTSTWSRCPARATPPMRCAPRPRSSASSSTRAGLDVLFDDRDGRPGVKFADADLRRHAGAGHRRRRRASRGAIVRAQGPGDGERDEIPTSTPRVVAAGAAGGAAWR